MPLTPEQFRDALVEHNLTLRHAANGWHAETTKGTRLHKNGKPTPEEAVEAALLRIADTDLREGERRAARAVLALDRGRYYIRCRMAAGVDGEGNPVQQLVFDGMMIGNGVVPSVRNRVSVLKAIEDMEELLGP